MRRPLLFVSAALIIDTYKITDELTKLVDDSTAQIFIRFVVLGAVGVGVIAAGIAYNRVSKDIAAAVERVTARLCRPCRRPTAKPADDSSEGERSAAREISTTV